MQRLRLGVTTEYLTEQPAQALAGLLDIGLPSATDLPPLWHWVYLLERRPQRDLGPDGHPRAGVPAPPGPGRLRMFAGGRVRHHRPLRFGAPALRTAERAGSVEKVGRAGPLSFVTVRYRIEQDGALAVEEEQDIVYRQAGSQLPAAPAELPEPAAGGWDFDVDPVVLFRFSALTYNAHRIHYDAPYCRQEGYPDLVVHGPLQALLMAEYLRRAGERFTGRVFDYRLTAATFGAQRLRVGPAGDGVEVRDAAGRRTATATLR